MKKKKLVKIDAFDFNPGDILVGKYCIIDKLGSGWEGEVYKIQELNTGIERAAKLFFPQHNIKGRAARFYARKLHKLRQCQILIHYHTEETIYIEGVPITILISEYVEGELLSEFVKSYVGRKMPPFQALQMLYALTKGIESVHMLNEYHGDLHMENVIVNRIGVSFHIKLLDMFHWGASTNENRKTDICDLIRIFYDCLGGAKQYPKHPFQIRDICCGLKRSLIYKKFKTATHLREYIETLSW